jgi:hypothetical protein
VIKILHDCNDCKWLDLTEREEQELEDKCHRLHFCRYYNQRVFHRVRTVKHDPYLYPCKKCENENYEHFKKER